MKHDVLVLHRITNCNKTHRKKEYNKSSLEMHRFRHCMIHSVGSWRAAQFSCKPLVYCNFLPIGRITRAMSTGRKKDFPNPSLFDHLPDVPTDPDLMKDVRSFFDSNRKEHEPNFSILLRRTIESICPNLSPQESFEYRLVSCIGSLCNPVGAITSNDDKGIGYRISCHGFPLGNPSMRKPKHLWSAMIATMLIGFRFPRTMWMETHLFKSMNR